MRKRIPPSQLRAAQSYVRRKLLPRLGDGWGEVDFEVLDASSRGPVLLCRGRQHGCVVKMYRSPKRFYNAKLAHEYFSEHGIPCPQLLDLLLCTAPRAGFGKFVLVQEEIRGLRLEEIGNREEALTLVGEALAFLHSHSSITPGPFFRPPTWRNLYQKMVSILNYGKSSKSVSSADIRLAQSMRRLEELKQREGLTQAEAEKLAHSLNLLKPPDLQDGHYYLIHGDLASTQLIIRDGSLTFIDLDSARFDNFVYELTRAEQMCRDGHERETLYRSYFAIAGQNQRRIYDHAKRFYELTFHLGRANHWHKRSVIRIEGNGDHFREQYLYHKEQMLSCMQ